jgi:hypothetical protein
VGGVFAVTRTEGRVRGGFRFLPLAEEGANTIKKARYSINHSGKFWKKEKMLHTKQSPLQKCLPEAAAFE